MPRSKEVPEDLRKKIIETYQAGNGYKNIAKILSIPKTTVRGIVCKWKRFGTITTLPRSGRPPKISPKGREIIIQEVMNNPCTTAKKLQATLASANIHVHDSTIRKVIIMHARPSLTCFGSNIDKTTMCQEDRLDQQIKVENDEQLIDGNSDLGSYDTEGCSGNGKNVSRDYVTGDGVLKNERTDCDITDDDDDDDGGSNIKRQKVGDEGITDDGICDKNGLSDADNISDNSNSDDNGWREEDRDLGDKGDSDDQNCVDIGDDGGSNCSNSDKIQGNDIDEGIQKSECVEDLDDDDDNDDENKRSNDDKYFTAKLAVDQTKQSGETYGGDEIAENFGNDEDEQMSNHSVDDNTRADRAENQKQSNHDAIFDNEDQRKTVDDVGNIVDEQKMRHNESHINKNNNNNNNADIEKQHGKDKRCATKASKDGNGNSSDGYDIGPSSEFEENAFDYNAGSWDEWGWV